ncbi:DUF359 domain-containing protein [Candidatus Micrarchaeota archaeon]|nr:DUF359 domain-containing protein [Candidatus Micrarchaeota archaeon]
MKVITPALTRALKKPLGALFGPGQKAKLKAALAGHVVYAVGDATVQTLFKLGMHPHVRVYDLKTRREPLPAKQAAFFDTLTGQRKTAVNPAGHISPSLDKAVCAAVRSMVPVNLFVIGEEDLAVIPLLLHAPLGVKICYGQPKKGIVVLDVDEKMKAKAHVLYGQFKSIRM